MAEVQQDEGEQAHDDPGRSETEAQRDDRNLSELIQELRVAGLGVQVLFGFLLALPFSKGFPRLDGHQRDIYVVSVLLATLSTALLVSPVAYHRLVFRRHQKGRVVRFANVMALAGLAAVALAVSGSVLLLLSFVTSGPFVPIVAAAVVCVFFSLWCALPLAERRASGRAGVPREPRQR